MASGDSLKLLRLELRGKEHLAGDIAQALCRMIDHQFQQHEQHVADLQNTILWLQSKGVIPTQPKEGTDNDQN